MNPPKRILIIGGGYTGLTAAYELSKQAGLSISVIERSDQIGGLASGFSVQGTNLEKAYHHLFRTDRHVLELANELGVQDKLLWCSSSMGIFLGGRIYPFMSPMDLLRFSPCPLSSRLRIGLVMLYLQKAQKWGRFTTRTAYDWMAKTCGKDAMRTIWEPLLRGKFDRHFDKVSMAWLWARIHIRVNSRKGSAGVEKLGYFRGGFNELTRRLEEELIRRGVRLETRAEVNSLGLNERWALVNGRHEPFDRCLFTGPCSSMAKLLPEDSSLASYKRQLESIAYLGAICLIFVSDQDLGGPYWLNVNEAGAPFLVCLQHTRLVGPELYGGYHVYYLGAYRPHESTAFTRDEQELTNEWLTYVGRIFPHFDRKRIVEQHLFRFKWAQHVVDVPYPQQIPSHRTPLPGVFMSNFAQIFPEDRGTNYAVREGRNIAQLILEDLRGSQDKAAATLPAGKV